MFDGLKNTFSKFTSNVDDSTGDESDSTIEPDDESVVEPNSDSDSDSTPGIASRAKSLATGKVVIDAEDLDGPLSDLELELLSQNVEVEVVDAILSGVRDNLSGETRRIGSGLASPAQEALSGALDDILSRGQYDLLDYIEASDGPTTLVFTGINGVGKTTTIAKLSRYFEEQGYSTVMANGDTYRAGAEEQIARHADNLGTKLISHEQGGDPTAVLYDAVEYAKANDVDVVLGDTAGRLHTDASLMSQLEKINRVVDPEFTIYVDEAVAGQDAVHRVRGFDEAAEIDGVILTKAEADKSGGAAISMAHVTGRPVLYLGVGQGYGDIVRFEPDELVEKLV